MIRRRALTHRLRRTAALLGSLSLLCISNTSFAESNLPSSALQNLARQFSQTVGKSLDQAEDALTSRNPADKKAQQALAAISDGEMLLLTTSLRDAQKLSLGQVKVEDPMTAIKQGQNLFYSMTDFNYIAGFNIKLDSENRRADGYYIEEDKVFALDLDKREVILDDTVKNFNAEDILVQNDDFYIRDTVLAEWFNFTFKSLPQGQLVEISTYQQFPVQAQLSRQKRRQQLSTRIPVEQPRLPQENQVITAPRADIFLGTQWEKRGDDSEPNNYSTYSILTSNQLLGHEMSGYLNGTLVSSRDSEPLQQARINFRKESEQNDLLGPLNARVYEFNDLSPVSIPYTGGASYERGLRVSNQSERYSVDTQTNIEGDAQPGWDIELYRNQAFVAGTTVDNSGRFLFENVPLFAGDNRFRIVKFGLFGEQQEEERLITVLPSLVGNMKGYYNLSLSQKDEITYQANQTENQDRGTLRLVGRYDRRAGDNLTLRGGIHSRETQGQRDNYFYSGAVTSLGETIINGDMITTSDGPFRGVITGRRRFGRHNGLAGVEYLSTDFSETLIDETVSGRPAEQSLFAGLSGPFLTNTFKSVTYDTDSRVSQDENGRLSTNNDFGLSSSYRGFRFNNEISFSTDSESSDRSEVLSYAGSISNRIKGYNWRGRIDYEVVPESEPNTFLFDINKNYSARLQANAGLQHRFYSSVTDANVGFSYLSDKARISPNVSYDSEQNMRARVDVTFGLAKDPLNGNIIMSGRGLSNQGSLSAFTYLDKNGNGIYDGEDEPLPDVVIRAVQANAEMITDTTGNAATTSMRANRLTDVVMEESSSFEPTWVSGYEGASVLLRPTETVRLEFPVLRGAEIDGTASVIGTTGAAAAARSITINLTTPDGEIVKSTTTPFDGFYVIERIRPGVYYMTTDSSQSPTTAYRLPEKIIVTPEGGQFYGKNIELTRGYDIPFTFSAANANPSLQRRTKILKPEDIAREDVYIRLGNYRSGVALALDWYKFKLRTRSWQNSLSPVVADFDTLARDPNTSLLPLRLQPTQPLRLSEAALLCERLVDAGFEDCGVDVVTTYQGDAPEAAAASPTPSKG